MKVLHIASADSGGACGAAMRIHRCLHEFVPEVESKALVIWKNKDVESELYSIRDSYKGIRKLQLKIIDNVNNFVLNKIIKGKTNKLSVIYKNYRSFYRPENHHLVADWADVIHLHFTNNFINFPTFFKTIRKLNKPIVWSFHDMAPFTGGNPYENENMQEFLPIYDSFLEYKKKYLKKGHVFGHATTKVFKDKAVNKYHTYTEDNCNVIPYPLDTSVFNEKDRTFARNKYKLPLDKKILLFVCTNLKAVRKGFYLLNEKLDEIVKHDFHLAVVGRNISGIPDHEHIHKIGFIANPEDLSELYSAVDLFVTPSIEEAYGQTTTEALACGTPVIAFQTAGAIAQILHGINGYLCEEISSQCLYENIVEAMDQIWDRDSIASDAKSRFNAKDKAEEYFSMYKKMLNQ